MDNNDIFKKLRVALQLRDDQIVEILQLVDFRISKSELSAFFRKPDHPNYMECGDQVLRNFLNGLVIHLRGTKEEPKNPTEVLAKNTGSAKQNGNNKAKANIKPDTKSQTKPQFKTPVNKKFKEKKSVVEKVKFNNGKDKKSSK
ncbi:hypothetical protein GCM10007424_04940 [Flavobacterium suaedae]|uniref:DUF1456 family protein n=1 Tax=Flavobacterium suaedae TaxID=1767027 RepID=A0ABQ1JGS0_9FLAO|nr:DUF1456 family protein [Flavobacterium suaedae]GGB67974.1 hypothetical protein GCM10007424_04940 [Flavobacterium suaedae]